MKLVSTFCCFWLAVGYLHEASATGRLKVIVSPPSKIYKIAGTDFGVICEVFGLDPGSKLESISWIDPQGRNLSASNSSRIILVEKSSTRRDLLLKDVRSTDAGIYKCRVQTSVGDVTSIKDFDTELVLYEFKGNQTTREGFSVYLHCPKTSGKWRYHPWKFNGKYLPSNDRIRFRPGGMDIRNVQFSDAGIYTCKVEDKSTGEIIQEDVHIKVEPRRLAVTFWSPYPKVYKAEGGDFVALCDVYDVELGHKLDSISWIDPEGRNLSASNSTRIATVQKHGILSNLIMKDIRSSDTGIYKCRVKTSIGSVTNFKDFETELEIYGLPVPVISSADVIVRSGDRKTLKCSGQTNANPAIAWEQNRKDLYNEIILKRENNRISREGLHIRDASESDAGIYTCRMRDENTGVTIEERFNVTVSGSSLQES